MDEITIRKFKEFLTYQSRPRATSVGGITAKSVQPQGEIQEEGRTEKNKKIIINDLIKVKQLCQVWRHITVWTEEILEEGGQ